MLLEWFSPELEWFSPEGRRCPPNRFSEKKARTALDFRRTLTQGRSVGLTSAMDIDWSPSAKVGGSDDPFDGDSFALLSFSRTTPPPLKSPPGDDDPDADWRKRG